MLAGKPTDTNFVYYNIYVNPKEKNEMLLESAPAFKMLDVYRIKRERSRGSTFARPWAAIALRLSGSSQFEYNGISLSANEGSVIYIPEGVGFSRRGTDEELIIIHLNLYGSSHSEIEVFDPKNRSLIFREFISLYEEWKAKRPGYQYRCAALLLNILAELTSVEQDGKSSYKTGLILSGAELINSDFSNPDLTVEYAAMASSVSPEYFRAIYKSVYGVAPHRAIENKRIDKACRLLASGYFSISRVAEECGFSNAKHFSALFHKRIGVTPREYKRSFNP